MIENHADIITIILFPELAENSTYAFLFAIGKESLQRAEDFGRNHIVDINFTRQYPFGEMPFDSSNSQRADDGYLLCRFALFVKVKGIEKSAAFLALTSSNR